MQATARRETTMKTLFTIALAALVLVAVPQGARCSELIECLEETPTIFGTPGDDALTGTDESDAICRPRRQRRHRRR